MTAIELAAYCRRIRTEDQIPRLRAIAHELETSDPNDEATQGLLVVFGQKVVRLERSN